MHLGIKGKATRGGATGGKILGYVKEVLGFDAPGRQSDRLVICEEETALVRRIFQLYADDHSLKQTCKILNAERIPSPRARERGKYNAGIWNPSILSGDVKLGEGILNEIYIRRRIFNRRKWVEIPNDNRGVSRRPRLNPESERVVRDEPELRIIDQDLWDRVKARQSEARAARDVKFHLTGNPLAGAKRPAHSSADLCTAGSAVMLSSMSGADGGARQREDRLAPTVPSSASISKSGLWLDCGTGCSRLRSSAVSPSIFSANSTRSSAPPMAGAMNSKPRLSMQSSAQQKSSSVSRRMRTRPDRSSQG